MPVEATSGASRPSEQDVNDLRNPVSVCDAATPTPKARPARPAKKMSDAIAEPNVAGPATRTSGRKRPTKSQDVVPEPEAPSSHAIPSGAAKASQQETSVPSRPETTGTDLQASKSRAAGDDSLSTIPSPLLRGLTEEQIQAIVQMVKAQ